MSHAPGAPLMQAWAPVPQRTRTAQALEVVGIAFGAVGVLAMIALVSSMAGVAGTAVAGVLAFIPLVVVVLGIRWIDKWEPEPRLTLLAAFLWGAGVSTFVSLVFNSWFAVAVAETSFTSFGQLVLSTAVVAPVVEETTKGLGVLLVFLLRRRFFDGPVDGVVYAATVAAGFTFVENILYFAQYVDSLGSVFIGRAVMAPFAHVVFTAMTGIMLGLASRQHSRRAWLWLFPVGLACAILLHGLWNFSTMSGKYLFLYLFLQIPVFVGLVALVSWLRSLESAVIRNRLGEYARAGWLAPHEVAMVASFSERGRARAWAARFGRRDQMVEFQRRATNLAYARERAFSGRLPATAAADQAHMLTELTRARQAIHAGLA